MTPANAMHILLPPAVFILLVYVLAAGMLKDDDVSSSALLDQPLPAFSAPQLDAAEPGTPGQTYAGRYWVLNIWASWCLPCLAELPQLHELRAAGLPVVGLAYKDEEEDARAWLAQHGSPFAMSLQDRDGRLGIELGVTGVPETFLIDPDGMVVLKHIGPMVPADAERLLEHMREDSDDDA